MHVYKANRMGAFENRQRENSTLRASPGTQAQGAPVLGDTTCAHPQAWWRISILAWWPKGDT